MSQLIMTEAPPPGLEPAPLDTRRRRILFRATHRGMHEADVLFGGFVTARIASFTDAELDTLEEILEFVDADLVDWLLGRAPVPADRDTPMLRQMLDNAHNRGRKS
jgi:antitoxin CptB